MMMMMIKFALAERNVTRVQKRVSDLGNLRKISYGVSVSESR